MQADELVLTSEVRLDLDRLRELLIAARAGGAEGLLIWADLAMQWAEAAGAELAILRPKTGQAYIDSGALISAGGRRYCLKHPGYELHDDRRCIRCEEIKVWLQSPIHGVRSVTKAPSAPTVSGASPSAMNVPTAELHVVR
jgi:hypothetical protein